MSKTACSFNPATASIGEETSQTRDDSAMKQTLSTSKLQASRGFHQNISIVKQGKNLTRVSETGVSSPAIIFNSQVLSSTDMVRQNTDICSDDSGQEEDASLMYKIKQRAGDSRLNTASEVD